jgi:regulator of sigma E protease
MQAILNAVEEGREVPVLVLRNGQEEQIMLTPKLDPGLRRRIIRVSLSWNIVSDVEEGSLAYQTVRPGDTIVTINGQVVYNNVSMSKALRAVEEGEEINLVLFRDGNMTTASLPRPGYETLPGVEMRWVDEAGIEQERLPVWRAVFSGAMYIIYMPVLIVEAIPVMIERPDLALVGPIGAGQLTLEVVHAAGLSNMLFMAGMISLGLAIFNLFPILPLDGGGMLVAFIEGLRGGKRLSPKTVRLARYIGTALLIALVVLVTFSDVYRLIIGEGFGL